MKRLTTPLLLAVLVLSAAAASAQTTFRLGVRGGANRALTTLDGTRTSGIFYNASGDKSPIYAWQAGVVLEAVSGKFAFQPAVLFSQKGDKLSTTETFGDFGVSTTERTSTNRYNWVEMPLNVVYTLHGDHGLQLFAGPYVALAVGGQQRGTTVTYPVYAVPPSRPTPVAFDTEVAYGSDTDNRRLDAGVNFGIGYRQGPLQVQLGYGLGLRNLHHSEDADSYDSSRNFSRSTSYNRVAQLTGTYFLSL